MIGIRTGPPSLGADVGDDDEGGGLNGTPVTRMRQRWGGELESERQNKKRELTLRHIEQRLIGSQNTGKKMIGLE